MPIVPRELCKQRTALNSFAPYRTPTQLERCRITWAEQARIRAAFCESRDRHPDCCKQAKAFKLLNEIADMDVNAHRCRCEPPARES